MTIIEALGSSHLEKYEKKIDRQLERNERVASTCNVTDVIDSATTLTIINVRKKGKEEEDEEEREWGWREREKNIEKECQWRDGKNARRTLPASDDRDRGELHTAPNQTTLKCNEEKEIV